MALYREHGSRGIIFWVTVTSIGASLIATLLSLQLVTGDWLADRQLLYTAIILAVVVPGCVAPAASYCIASLLTRLDDALAVATRLSVTDPLTGSANRRGFFSSAELSLKSFNHPAYCLVGMVDMDRFKEINDGHGHETGDAALIAASNTLSSVIGDRGNVGRIGGDEFAFYFLAHQEDRERLHTTLQQRFSNLSVKASSKSDVPVRASIGLVALEPEESFDEALARADAKVYKLKAERGARSANARASRAA